MCLGLPGQIVGVVDARLKLARVAVAGVTRTVNIACIVDETHTVDACVGDWVLVHVGFAMARIDEAEAQRTIELLTELGEAQAELAALEAAPK
jgi:hydrogenase expression/formation protein HypC